MTEIYFKIFQDKGDQWNKIGEMMITMPIDPGLCIHEHSYITLSTLLYVQNFS